MGDFLIIALIAAFLFSLVALAAARGWFKGATEEFGRIWARGWADARRQAEPSRRLKALASPDHGPSTLLAAAAGTAGEQALAVLQQWTNPCLDGAALINAVQPESATPWAGRTAFVVGVGPGMSSDLELLLAHTGRQVVGGAFLIGESPSPVGVEVASGDLEEQARAGRDWLRAKATAPSTFAAILLRAPISGTWATQDEGQFERLVRALLPGTADTWVCLTEPRSASAWPTNVELALPITFKLLMKTLPKEARPKPTQRSRGESATISGDDAAGLIIGVTQPGSTSRATFRPPDVKAHYSPRLTLLLSGATQRGAFTLERDTHAREAAEAFLKATHVRTYSVQQGTRRELPLSVYPELLIGSLQKEPQGQEATGLAQEPSRVQDDVPRQWLASALDRSEESVAAAVLADWGRAWIEQHDLDPVLGLLRRAEAIFEPSTRARLWARYLLALDSALRKNLPDEDWFSGVWCSAADETELATLFRMERLEFSRLRGEGDAAYRGLRDVLAELPFPAPNASSAARYAAATTRYVGANILRSGGRYEMARSLIESAIAIYDPAIAAHRIELLHCRYALSVCDSMRGVATISSGDNWPEEAAFARALGTLANCHAAWFSKDLVAASGYAGTAAAQFDEIHYERYARRAKRLGTLLEDWAALESSGSADARPVMDPRVRALVSATAGTHVAELAVERPSRALSLLQFAVRFNNDPSAPVTVELPTFLDVTSDGEWLLIRPEPARTLAEAHETVRLLLGVGEDQPIPLAVD